MRNLTLGRAAVLSALLAAAAAAGDPALTIYNQNFAVVRETVPLNLQPGANRVRFSGASAHVEPDSVILRDAVGKRSIQILEQNYRADPLSQGLLLSIFEGKTIDFLVQTGGVTRTVPGRIVRSGYVPHYAAFSRYGPQYVANQNVMMSDGGGQPIIEVDGKLQFQLPGQPLFPALGDDTVLKPTLDWLIQSPDRARFDAELSYVTGGMSWTADYNAVAPETGDSMDLSGWVTLDNQSGKQFDNARIKLMAGDVSKIQQAQPQAMFAMGGVGGGIPSAPPVKERTFDDYHLYELERPATIHDRESKQVEFLRANGVGATRLYVYDGAQLDRNIYGYGGDMRFQREYGTRSNTKVWTMLEFVNSQANHLGMPLPAGRVRFYRRDRDGQLEFIGENQIDHTPKDERVRLYTGNAFDIAGERRQVTFQADQSRAFADESFEIKLRNHKQAPATVRIVEHLYRWHTWGIATASDPFRKVDSSTIEFEVTLAPGAEKTVTYLAHYTW